MSDLATDVYRHGERGLVSASSAEEISLAMGEIVRLSEERLESELCPEGKGQIACAAGCRTCCIVNVAVLFPEAVAITEHVRRHWSRTRIADLIVRLDELYTSVAWLDDEERIILRRACAFLNEEGSCSIYPVRPLLCRSVTSTDPEACRQAVVAETFGETRPILMNLRQKEIMETSFHALGRAVEDVGLDPRGVKLTVAVRALLADPDLACQWLSGAEVPAG